MLEVVGGAVSPSRASGGGRALNKVKLTRHAHLIWLLAAYLVLALLLYASRLTSILYAESSAVVAFFGFFVTGVYTFSRSRAAVARTRVLVESLGGLIVPWLLLTLSLSWVPNCAYGTGLLLYGAFTAPSVVLGFAIALLLDAHARRFRRIVFFVLGVLIAVGGVVYDLALHPQFFTLNHVFGGVLGPIYEDALYVRPGLFAFRIQTLLWAGIAVVLARRRFAVDRGSDMRAAGRAAVVAGVPLVLGIGLIYAAAAPLGINTPAHRIRTALGSSVSTEHFDIHYDARALDARAVLQIADEHEYRFDQLAATLGVAPVGRIQTYLFPTISSKIRLTGAGVTDVAPVWLRAPQVHLLLSSYSSTLGHELVHVFSREFGLPILRASRYVALVEGLAVSLEPPMGLPTPREQVAVSLRHGELSDVGIDTRLAHTIERMMSPRAFWGGRGAVSYTVAGAFIGYLLESEGVEKLRRVYATGAFERVYGVPLRELARAWEADVRGTPYVTIAAHDVALRRFTVPSLFERDCPHYQPPHVAAYRSATDELALGDTASARRLLNVALRRRPSYTPAVSEWARLALVNGEPEAVAQRLSGYPDSLRSVSIDAYHGDAVAMLGDTTAAMRRYRAALERLPAGFQDTRASLLIRLLGGGDSTPARLLLGLDPDPSTVELPASVASRIAAALRMASAGRYEDAVEAVASLEAVPLVGLNPAEIRFLSRMLHFWSGIWARRAGREVRARQHLHLAHREATIVGDYPHAALIADEIERAGGRRHINR